MGFTNLIFLYLFLPITFLLYFLVKDRRAQNVLLIVFSLVFYAWGEPLWVFMLLVNSFIDYTIAKQIEKNRENKLLAQHFLITGLFVDIGLLAIFKYSFFAVENVNLLLGTQFAVPALVLPMGISFYTFQTVSYLLDVYNGKVEAQKTFYKYLLYFTMFFQIMSGPIVRYSAIEDQIENRTINLEKISRGVTRMLTGLFKKIVIANSVGALALQFMTADPAKASFLGAWFGVLMYTLQIYYDFSGYSDMAIALAGMFGFEFPENFNYPYISQSISEFWRRWHISLGSFFRNYVYIPLGGNRKHQYRNLFVVWLLTGLWHGASWNFIIWGVYFGVLITLERLFLKNILDKIPQVLRHGYTMFFVMLGWVIFYFTNFGELKAFFAVLFDMGGAPLSSTSLSIVFMNNIFIVIGAVVFCLPLTALFKNFANKLETQKQKALLVLQPVYNVVLLVICTAYMASQTFNAFLYTQF